MTLDNYGSNSGGNYGKALDPIAQRKLEVRKRARHITVAAGIGAVSLALGLTIWHSAYAFFGVIIPLLMVAYIAYSGMKIKKVVEHKDQW